MTAREEALRAWFPEDDAADLLVGVRVRSRWDEERFVEMLRTAHTLLDELERAHDGSPGSGDPAEVDVPGLFEGEIPSLVAHVGHPGFLAENDLGLGQDEFRAWIGERVAALALLRARREEILGRTGRARSAQAP